MKTARYRIHAIFTCSCGKEWQAYRTAQRQAYAHAKQTGHQVRGEIATAFHYNHA